MAYPFCAASDGAPFKRGSVSRSRLPWQARESGHRFLTPAHESLGATSTTPSKVLIEPLEPRYLLSADLMPFQVDMAVDGDDLTLRLDDVRDYLQILNNKSGGVVIAEKARSDATSVRVLGSDSDDRFVVDFGVNFSLPFGISFEAGLGNDQLAISNGIFDTVSYGALSLGAGLVNLFDGTDSEEISFSDTEEVDDDASAANRAFSNDTGASQTIRLSDADAGSDGASSVGGGDFTPVTFSNPIDSLTLAAGDFGDLLILEDFDPGLAAAVHAKGGAGVDTVVGSDSDNVWTLDGADSGSVSGAASATFAGVENVTGGSGADTFTVTATGNLSGAIDGGGGTDTLAAPDTDNVWEITGVDAGTLNAQGFANVENLQGGAGNDTFRFLGGSISGTIDGGGGINSLDFSASSSDVTVDLGAGAATDAASFANITDIAGGTGNDTISGPNAASVYTIDGANSGTAAGVAFRDVENLQGASGDDTFIYALGGELAGLLSGGLGTDTLFAADGSNIFTVTAENAGLLNARAFSEIENLEGGDLDDAFLFAAGGLLSGAFAGGLGNDRARGADQRNTWRLKQGGAGKLNDGDFGGIELLEGGADEDTLIGPAEDSTWRVDGANSGDIAGASFTGMENLSGAADNEDTFVFTASGSLSGQLEGGDGGFDSIVLDGTGEQVIYTFTGPHSGSIERFPGDVIVYDGFEPISTSPSTIPINPTDVTLNYTTAGTLTISGAGGQITVTGTAAETVTFNNPSGTLTINASTGSDTINVQDLGTFSGTLDINAGDGDDIVDIQAVTTTATYDINGGTSTDTIQATATFSQNISLSNSELTIGTETISISSFGRANLTGGGGANEFTVSGWSGTGTLNGAGGDDTVVLSKDAANFQLFSATLTAFGGPVFSIFDIETADLTGGPGENTFSINNWNGTANVSGGSGDDNYVLGDSWSTVNVTELTSGGSDTLDFSSISDSNTLSVSADKTTINAFDGSTLVQSSGPGAEIVETVDVLVDASLRTALNDTLSDFVALIDRIENTATGVSQLINTLPLLSPDSINDSLSKISQLRALFEDFRAGVAALTSPTFSQLIDDINALLLPTPVDSLSLTATADYRGAGTSVGAASGVLELLIDLDILTTAIESLILDLGEDARLVGLDFGTPAIDLTANIDADLTFGLDTSSDEFFLADGGRIDLSLSAAANLPALSLNIGFLDISIDPNNLTYQGMVRIDINEPGVPDGRITGTELTTTDLGTLLSTMVSGTSLDADATVSIPSGVRIGGVDVTSATFDLTLPSPDDIFGGVIPDVSLVSAGGDSLLDFSNLGTSEIMAMLEQLTNTLTATAQNQALQIAIPFTDFTVGDVLDFATAFKSGVIDPLFASGNLLEPDFTGDGEPDFSFGSIQELLTELSAVLGFATAQLNPANRELRLVIDFNRALGFGEAKVGTDQDGSASQNEIQTLDINAIDSGGTLGDVFKLGFTDSGGRVQLTTAIDSDAPLSRADALAAGLSESASIEAKLEALDAIDDVNVELSDDGEIIEIEFRGGLANTNVAQMISDSTQLKGVFPLDFGVELGDLAGLTTTADFSLAALLDIDLTFGIDLSPSTVIEVTGPVFNPQNVADVLVSQPDGAAASDRSTQIIRVDNATNGTFKLSFNGTANATGNLAYNISAANLETAIEGLTGITAVDVSLDTELGDRIYTVDFVTPANPSVLLAADAANLKGAADGILSNTANFSVTLFNREVSVEKSTGNPDASSNATTLINLGAEFISDGVQVGDVVFNTTDGSSAVVVSVDSETQITHATLTGGTANDWDASDDYQVSLVIPEADLGTFSVNVDRDTTNTSFGDLIEDIRTQVNTALINAATPVTLGFLDGSELSTGALGVGDPADVADGNPLTTMRDNINFTLKLSVDGEDEEITGSLRVVDVLDDTPDDPDDQLSIAELAAPVSAARLATVLNTVVNDTLDAKGFEDFDVTIGTSGGRLTFAVDAVANSGDTVELVFQSPIQVEGGGGRVSLVAKETKISTHLLEPAVTMEHRLETFADFENPAYQELGLLSAPTRFDGVTSDVIEFTLEVDGTPVSVSLAAGDYSSVAGLRDALQVAVKDGLIAAGLLVASADPDADLAAAKDIVEAFLVDPDGNRLGLRGGTGIAKLTLDVPDFDDPNPGAITELGFDSGDGQPQRSRASEFFLENVSLTGTVDLDASSVSTVANIGFLEIEATGSGSLSATADLSFKNPEDGGTRLNSGVLADALRDGRFLFDDSVAPSPATPTGFLDPSFSGGLDIDLEVEPSGPLAGLPGDLDASLQLTLQSPDWFDVIPNLSDPLGFGTDLIEFDGAGGTTFTLGAAPGDQLESDVTFIISNDGGTTEALGFLDADDTAGFTTPDQYKTALQSAIDNALLELGGGTITVDVDGSGNLTLVGDAGLSFRGSFTFSGPDIDSILNQFKDLSFEDIIAGLRFVVDFLRSLDGSDGSSGGAVAEGLDFNLPVIDRSLSDLLDFASDLLTRIELIAENPEGSIQALEDALRESLGIPTGQSHILSFDPLSGVLGIDFDFETSAGVAEPFILDIADAIAAASLPDFLSDIVTANASGNLSGTAGVDLALRFGLDLTGDDKALFMRTGAMGTRFTAFAEAALTNPMFELGLGPFTVFSEGGTARVGGSFDVSLIDTEGDLNDERFNLITLGDSVSINLPGTDNVSVSITGDATVDLPLFIGTPDNPVSIDTDPDPSGPTNVLSLSVTSLEDLFNDVGGAFNVTLPDLNLFLEPPDLFLLLANPSLLVSGLDKALLQLERGLKGQIFDFELPLVGAALADNPAANFVNDIREELLQPLARTLVENNVTLGTVDPGTGEGDGLIGLIQETIFDVFGPGGAFGATGLLKDAGTDGITKADIVHSGADLSTILAEDFIQFDFSIGQTKVIDLPDVDFDFGIPGLGISADFMPRLTLEWMLDFGFGVDKNLGFYFVAEDDPSNPELALSATLDLGSAAGPLATATGELGFLALRLTDGVDVDDDADLEFTELVLAGMVDLVEPSGDGRLTPSELVSTPIGDIFLASLSGDADIRLHGVVDFSVIDPSLTRVLPSVSTDFLAHFGLNLTPADGFTTEGPDVAFLNVSLDVGSFISDFAGPILSDIGDVLDNVDWLVGPDGFLNKRIPLISDLAGKTITGKDLVKLFDPKNGPKVVAVLDAIDELFFFINLITDAAREADGGNLIIDFGDLVLTGADFFNGLIIEGGVPLIDNLIDLKLPDLDSSTIKSKDLSAMTLPEPPPVSGKKTSRFVSGVTSEGSLQFNLFEPETIFKLILGQPDITLFTYELPEFGFEFFYRQEFPIFGPLVATFGGGVAANFDFGFGYDSRGLQQFLASENPAFLLNGFFLNDLDPATGFDRPEVTLSAQIAVGAGISLGLAKAGVEGGIEATIFFNLSDLDRDGKVRFDELAANLIANSFIPVAIFDISGQLEFFLRAFLEINLLFTKIRKDFEFVRLTLFEFDIPFKRPAIMASQSGDVLTLNVGQNSASRLNGNLADIGETVEVKTTSDGGVVVWSDQFLVTEGIAGINPFFGVKKIVAFAGAGNDVIDLTGVDVAHIPDIEVEIHGGIGNDTIIGSSAGDMLFGGAGRDIIRGRDGDDFIDGGLGDDFELSGNSGNDQILGGPGIDNLFGNGEDDTLDGGTGEDFLDGGPGDDFYALGSAGSLDIIDGGGDGLDFLDFRDKIESVSFFLRGGKALAGWGNRTGTFTNPLNTPALGNWLEDFEHMVATNVLADLSAVFGGFGADIFHVYETRSDDVVTLLDGKGADDTYIFYAEDGTPIDVFVIDEGNTWDLNNTIEVRGTSEDEDIVLTANDITLTNPTLNTAGLSQVVRYEAPLVDENLLRIKVKSFGGEDKIDIDSTAITVPVKVFAGSEDDTLTVGDGTVNNINAVSKPGLEQPFGLGPLVLLGEGGHDTIIVDDSADSAGEKANGNPTVAGSGTTLNDSTATFITDGVKEGDIIVNLTDGSSAEVISVDSQTQITHTALTGGTLNEWLLTDDYSIPDPTGDVGYLTSFVEDRPGGDQVEVGVVNDLGMTLNKLIKSSIDNDEFDLVGSPPSPVDLSYTLDADGDAVFVDILDENGIRVSTFAGTTGSGLNTVSFDGTDFAGDDLDPGTYTFKIRAFIVTPGRVEFEGFEAVDVRLGFGADTFTVGVEDIFDELSLSRQDEFVGFTHTIDGMTTVSGGGGIDTIGIETTNTLDRDTLNAELGIVSATTLTEGVDGVSNETQKVFIDADIGTFTLKFRFQETAPIQLDASALEVKEALEKLFIIGENSVDVTEVSDGYEIEFVNDLGNTDVAPLQARVTPMAIFGGAGSDFLLVEAINQDMFFLGGAGDDTVRLNFDIDSLMPLTTNGVNAEVTLNGESDSDTYNVGLIGGDTNSLIHVFDSGGPGTDVLNIEGTENADVFLLRAAAAQSGLAFVALLNQEPNFERVNYDTRLETINVFGKGDNDEFYIDDTRAAITIDAGDGDDFFQVGQLFKSQRTTEQAGVAPEDVFATIETTRGFLSNGISVDMTINAGDGDDEFIVFHNRAVLTANGEGGDDRFLIQAFALVGSQEDERQRTDVTGGDDADFIAYAVNAPVSINGGDGFDTVVVVGTEFGDDIVVTEDGIFGAGVNVKFVNVEEVEVSGAEGDDRFFILGTGETFSTRVVGDLGADTFFINGETPQNGVISNDLRGHSGILSHSVDSSTDSDFEGQPVVGVSANVADNDEPGIIVTQSNGDSQVVEGGAFDSYTVVLSRPPRPGTRVKVQALPPEDLVFVEADGVTEIRKDDGTADGVELKFNDSNWNVAQTVRFKAIADGIAEGDRTAAIQHKVSTFDVVNEPVFETQEVFETVPIFFFKPIFKKFNVGFFGSVTLLVGFEKVQIGSFQVLIGTEEVLVDNVPTEVTVSDAFTGVIEKAIGEKSDVVVETTVKGDADSSTNEVQTITVKPGVGSFTLRSGLDDSDPIFFADTAADLETKLADLEGVGPGNVNVDKIIDGDGNAVFTLTFIGDLAATNVDELIARVAGSLIDDDGEFPIATADPSRPEGLRGSFVTIIDDPGNPSSVGQSRLILSNTETVLTVDQAWDSLPSNQARYEVLQFNGLVIPTVEVAVEDADVGALVVSQTGSETVVSEGSSSGTDIVNVSLSKQPASGETVTVALNGHGQLEFSGADVMDIGGQSVLQFNEFNYNIAQQIIVSAVDDLVTEGFHRADLTFLASSSDAGSGYNGVQETLVASVGDNEHEGVLIRESNGSTDIVEGGDLPSFMGPGTDSYTVTLTKAPDAGEIVTVTVTAQPTRTSRTGSIAGHPDSVRSFIEQLEVSLDGITFAKSIDVQFDLDGTTANQWDKEQSVFVRAIDDDTVDGGDAKVFARTLDLANNIQGPLFIVGGVGVDRSGLFEREPVMLPVSANPAFTREVNFKDSMGNVLAATEEVPPGTPATITIDPNDPDLLDFLVETSAADIDPDELVGVAIEITRGEGKNKVRLIEQAEFDAGGNLLLTLNKAWDNPFAPPGIPDSGSQYTLFNANPNLLVNEAEQVDFLFFNDSANVNSFDDPGLPAGTSNPFAEGRMFFDNVNEFGTEGRKEILNRFRIVGFGMGGDRIIGAGSRAATQPGGITYEELELVEVNLGPGNNRLQIDDTVGRVDGFQTWTLVNTGEGNDVVTVDLNVKSLTLTGAVADATQNTVELGAIDVGTAPADDELVGQFITVTDADGESQSRRIASNTSNTVRIEGVWANLPDDTFSFEIFDAADGDLALNTEGGNDIVTAGTSTLPIVVFGGDGDDDITGGDGADIIFGDQGVVDYVDEGGMIVTRLGNAPEPITGDVISAASTVDGATLTAAGGFPTPDPGTGDPGLIGLIVSINSGKGLGQSRLIVDNDGTTLTLDRPWNDGGIPDSTSKFRISTVPEDQTDGIEREPTLVRTLNSDGSGVDTIVTGEGRDIVFGGPGGDILNAEGVGIASDIIVGDQGRANFSLDGVIEIIGTNDPDVGDADIITGGPGANIILGGAGGDFITAGGDDSPDIILGDNGFAFFVNGVRNEIATSDPADGGADTIVAGDGPNVLLGGSDADDITGGAAEDIILGDNGEAFFSNAGVLTLIRTVVTPAVPNDSGADFIRGSNGVDVVLGGSEGDTILAGGDDDARDIVLGDNGEAEFTDAGVLIRVETRAEDRDGNDDITAGNGPDVVLGGTGDDIILAATAGDENDLSDVLALIAAGDFDAIHPGNSDRDVILGDNGVANFTGTAVLLDIQTTEPEEGGSDIIVGGNGPDVIFGGSDNDVIVAGGDDDAEDIVIGDNGRATFEGTEVFDTPIAPLAAGPAPLDGEEFSVLSFNFNASSSNTSVDGLAGAPTAPAGTTLPAPRSGNWNNLKGDGPTTFGDESGEIIRFGDGEIAPGITVEWGEDLDTDPDDLSTDTHSQIKSPFTDDERLFEGYLYTSTDHTVGVNIAGLASHFQAYDVYVYLDADDSKSRSGTSVRQISAGGQTLVLDDPDGNTFSDAGGYVQATAADSIGNYVVFTGLTGDVASIRIDDIGLNDSNRPAITAVQVVGQSNPIDRIESTDPTYAGDDILLTGGGPDIAIGGGGSDLIETFGPATRGGIDTDVVAGDNARATFMFGELRKIETTDAGTAVAGLFFDDVIFTGNGEDIVLGGDGDDYIDTGVAADAFDNGDVTVLSLNFNSSVDKGQVTGVAGVVQEDNWNNLVNDKSGDDDDDDDDDRGPTDVESDLVLGDSTSASGITVEWGRNLDSSSAKDTDRDSHGQILNPDTQNLRLFEGYVHTSTSKTLGVDVTGLSTDFAGEYDVYVYLDADDGRSRSGTSVRGISDGNTTFYLDDADGNTFNGEFVEVSSTDPLAPQSGNYVVFRGLSGDGVSIRVDDVGFSSSNKPAITAIQIVGGPDKDGAVDFDANVYGGDFDTDRVAGDNGIARLFNGSLYELVTTYPELGGDDVVRTGEDGDVALGGSGADDIDGQGGHDVLLGDNARIIFFDDNVVDLDLASGRAGDGHGHDEENGFAPFDILGIELLNEDVGGNDILTGGTDDDLLYGQFGDDTFVFSGMGLGHDRIAESGDEHHGHDDDDDDHQHHSHGHGPNDLHDTLDFSGFLGPIDIDLDKSGRQTINGGRTDGDVNLKLTLFHDDSIENVIGSEFDDEIDGNDRNNALVGRGGNDEIDGEKGDDVLVGGDGDDEIEGGRGDDIIDGGDGNDELRGGSADDDDGDDDDDDKGGWNIILGGAGDDDIKGGNDRDLIDGEAGDDKIRGGSGDDILLGGDGDDDVRGGGGADIVEGGAGVDKVRGDGGPDSVWQDSRPGQLGLLGIFNDFDSNFFDFDGFFFTDPTDGDPGADDRPPRAWIQDFLNEIEAGGIPTYTSSAMVFNESSGALLSVEESNMLQQLGLETTGASASGTSEDSWFVIEAGSNGDADSGLPSRIINWTSQFKSFLASRAGG